MKTTTSSPGETPFDKLLYRLTRSVEHFYERGRPGAIFYVLGILVSGLNDDLYTTHLPYILAASGYFVLVWILRFLLKKPAFEQKAMVRWQVVNWVLLYSNSLVWTICFCWVLLHPEWQGTLHTMLLCTIAYATAASYQFSIHKIPSIVNSLIFFLPPVFTILLFRPDMYPLAIAAAVFTLYLAISGIRAHREYHEQIDLEIDLHETQREMRNMSMTDDLTTLANRRHYTTFLDHAFAHAKRNGQDLALIVMDLDHFKQINDEYGHATGDACLVRAASILKQSCKRETDLVARIGGEEFAIVLPDTSAEQAVHIVQKIQDTFERKNRIDSDLPDITFSAGVGAYTPERDGTPDDLFIRVDQAAYQAKEEGRNRIVNACV